MPNTSSDSCEGDIQGAIGFTHHPIPHFDSAVPADFLKAVVEMLFEHYGSRNNYLGRFPAAESHDLWPHYRRALVEKDMRRLADQHHLTAEPKPNKALSAYHTVVSAGPVTLTESYVEDRSYLPRPAEFRDTLTKTSQLSMFTDQEEPKPDTRIYVILTHGQSADDPSIPGFADILFPAKEGAQVLVWDRIRLFEDRFPDLVAQLSNKMLAVVATEEIEDEAKPKLRDNEAVGG